MQMGKCGEWDEGKKGGDFVNESTKKVEWEERGERLKCRGERP